MTYSHIHNRAIKGVISLMIVAALFINTTTVQAVQNSSQQGGIADFFTSLFGNDEPDPTAGVGFPLAGDRTPKKTVRVRLSFYSSDPAQTDATPCTPADGSDLCLMAERGSNDAIAANFLPLGTMVRFKDMTIDGIAIPTKTFVVRDRMNVRYNGTRHVDVYVAVLGENGKMDPIASKARAKQLGVKFAEMEVF